jgi:hypothetical protein
MRGAGPTRDARHEGDERPVLDRRWRVLAVLVIVAALAVLHVTNPRVGDLYGKFESENYFTSVDHPLRAPIDTHCGPRLAPKLLHAPGRARGLCSDATLLLRFLLPAPFDPRG